MCMANKRILSGKFRCGGNCEIKLYVYFAILDLQKENQAEKVRKKENV